MISALTRVQSRMGFVYARAAAACAALVLVADIAAAQTVVGTSMIDGERIEILSDNTWRFVDKKAAEAGCRLINADVYFCGNLAVWSPTDPNNNEISAQYSFDDRHYGQYVIEAFGSDDGLTTAFLRKVVIENAASAGNMPAEDIAILSVEDKEVSGHPGETIVYQLSVDGLEVVFSNTIVVLPQRSVQATTFAIGRKLTPKHSQLHEDFLSLTEIR